MLEIINNSTPAIRIIKVASCLTCTGKATLTYHIGSVADNEIHFRVHSNTGGGLFSAEWVSLNAIKPALDHAIQPITSFTLSKIFKGKSTNTPGFLMAVLKSEGLVRNLEGKLRGYEILDSTPFMDEVNALMASDVDLKGANIPANYKTSVALNKSAKSTTISAAPIKAKKSPPPIETPIAAPEAPIAS